MRLARRGMTAASMMLIQKMGTVRCRNQGSVGSGMVAPSAFTKNATASRDFTARVRPNDEANSASTVVTPRNAQDIQTPVTIASAMALHVTQRKRSIACPRKLMATGGSNALSAGGRRMREVQARPPTAGYVHHATRLDSMLPLDSPAAAEASAVDGELGAVAITDDAPRDEVLVLLIGYPEEAAEDVVVVFAQQVRVAPELRRRARQRVRRRGTAVLPGDRMRDPAIEPPLVQMSVSQSAVHVVDRPSRHLYGLQLGEDLVRRHRPRPPCQVLVDLLAVPYATGDRVVLGLVRPSGVAHTDPQGPPLLVGPHDDDCPGVLVSTWIAAGRRDVGIDVAYRLGELAVHRPGQEGLRDVVHQHFSQ